jgi:hypothetical protein
VLAELPFLHPEEPNRVYLDLAEEGEKPFVMMLDTGAAESVVTPLMARKLGITVRRTKRTPYRRGTRLGRDLEIWVDTRSSDTGSKTGWEYGLLGGSFLAEYVVEIDFPARRVRFLDRKAYEVPEAVDAPDERVVPLQLVGNRIALPVELDGKKVQVLLDTGAPAGLIVSGKAARAAGVDVGGLPYFGRGGTVLGPMDLHLYEPASFAFAGFPFEGQPVLVAPRGWYNQSVSTDSALGVDVLRQFVVRIDGVYRVWGVVPGGPAARYGLREDDAIVPAAGETLPGLDAVLARVRAREPLTVARPEGDDWVDLRLPAEPDPAAPPGP